MENAREIIYSHDLAGTITDVNWEAERSLGFSKNELVGMNFSALLASDQSDERVPLAWSGGMQRQQLRLLTKSGKLLQVEDCAWWRITQGLPWA